MANEKTSLPRRGFIKLINQMLLATGLAAILGPVVAFFWPAKLEEVPSEPVAVGATGSIPIGESKTIRFGRYPALVINTPEDGLLAHQGVESRLADPGRHRPAVRIEFENGTVTLGSAQCTFSTDITHEGDLDPDRTVTIPCPRADPPGPETRVYPVLWKDRGRSPDNRK